MRHLFYGGIHPRYNKEMSTQSFTLRTVTPSQVVIPMQQRLSTGPAAAKAAPVFSALGLYLAAQCFAGMIL